MRSPSPTLSGARPATPYTYTSSAVVASAPLAETIRRASTIVLGTVTASLPLRWETADGTRPANPHSTQELIFAPVEIAADEWLRGAKRALRIYVKALGGEIGQDRVILTPALEFQYALGERVLLFLRSQHHSDIRIGDSPVHDIVAKYLVYPDRRVRDVYPSKPFTEEYQFYTWQELLAAISAQPPP